MDAAALRPLRVGEVLDVGIKIYRRRFQTMVRAVAVIFAPLAVLNAVLYLSVSASDAETVSGGDVAAIGAASLIIAIVGFVANEFATAACLEIVAGDYLDRSPTWRESIGVAWHRLRSVIWVVFLHYFLAGLALFGCIAPGVWLWVLWLVAVPVLMVEGTTGMGALSRSRSLVRGRWWPVFGTYVLLVILTGIVQSTLNGILSVAAQENDVAYAVVQALATAVSGIVVTPFTATVVTVIYFDLRVRKEGFDLELLARDIGAPAPLEASGSRFTSEPAGLDEEPPFWPPPPGWQPGQRSDG
jgi:hypothetical protein